MLSVQMDAFGRDYRSRTCHFKVALPSVAIFVIDYKQTMHFILICLISIHSAIMVQKESTATSNAPTYLKCVTNASR